MFLSWLGLGVKMFMIESSSVSRRNEASLTKNKQKTARTTLFLHCLLMEDPSLVQRHETHVQAFYGCSLAIIVTWR